MKQQTMTLMTDEEHKREKERIEDNRFLAMYRKRGIHPITFFDKKRGVQPYNARKIRDWLYEEIPEGKWCDYDSWNKWDVCHVQHVVRLLVRIGTLIEKEYYQVPRGFNPWLDPCSHKDCEYHGFGYRYARAGTQDPVWVNEEELKI